MKGKINTDKGTMVVEFYEKDAPNTVNNFVKLTKEGFYTDLNFHRVIPNLLYKAVVLMVMAWVVQVIKLIVN